MAISFDQALTVLHAGYDKAKALGINVSIAVLDPRGDVVAEARMDGARWWTVQIARGKAYGTALFGMSSADLASRAGNPFFTTMLAQHPGQIIMGQGALPAKKGDEMLGSVGVSGGTSEQDEEVAKAGIAALKL